MEQFALTYLKEVKELYEIYGKVKLAIIYAENFDPKQELYIAPINQLRSSLDHFFKAAAHPDDMEYELKEAKEHLDRAGYDAFEIFASNLGIIIVEKLNKYSTETLTTIFPDYYKIIKPKLIEIRANLGEIRKRKKTSVNGNNDSFNSYFSQIEVLLNFDKNVDYSIPALEEYHQKKLKEDIEIQKKAKKERQRDRFFNVVFVGIIAAIISGILVWAVTTHFQKSPTSSTTTNTTNSPVSR
jgi:predicted chitinase